MAIGYDYTNHLINITGQTTLDVQDLINSIRTQEATVEGIAYPKIAEASGKEDLGGSVSVGITVELMSPWQVKFEAGDYIAKISGGNLVGGIAGDPVAYSAGVQVLLIQSAASTVVTVNSGTGISQEEHDKLMSLPGASDVANTVWLHSDAVELTGITGGKWRIDRNLGVMIFYGKDNVTEIARFDLKGEDGQTNVDAPFERVRQ